MDIADYLMEHYNVGISKSFGELIANGRSISPYINKNYRKNVSSKKRFFSIIIGEYGPDSLLTPQFKAGDLEEEKGEGLNFSYYAAEAVFSVGIFDKRRILFTRVDCKDGPNHEDIREQASILGIFWRNVKKE